MVAETVLTPADLIWPLFIAEGYTENLLDRLKAAELDVLVLALPIDEPGLVVVADRPAELVRGAGRGGRQFVAVLDHLPQRAEAAIVHIGRAYGDVAQ